MLWMLSVALLLLAAPSTEGAGELAGFVAVDVRSFPRTPAFPEQRDRPIVPSLLLQPEYRFTWNADKDRVTLIPFARLEYDDDRRRHFDVRELNWLHIGPTWDVLFGVGKVFWGVAESRHLVDIINQTDLVEDPDAEDKLGQPMLRLALIQDWGTITLFALPFFRERTFPGRKGRLRSELTVDTGRASYESSLEEWHPDFAVRWTHAVGDWDIGVAHFSGTSREPRLLPSLDDAGRPELIPRYELIHQTSLDVQLTTGSLLGKLEVITQDGHGARFVALVAGFEYTFFGMFGTAIDLGVLAEYLYDGRGDNAPPTPFEDDVFFGMRLAFNDPQDTAVLAGAVIDRDTQAALINVEASRRFGERWTVELEARAFVNVPDADLFFGLRRDDYVQIRVAWFF